MWSPKVDVLGTYISCTSFDEVITLLETRDRTCATVINLCNVHSVMSARRDFELARAFERGDVNAPDGMPLVWFLRSRGYSDQTRVNGFDLTTRIIEHGVSRGWRHYFFGATDATLDRMTSSLRQRYPSIQIAGKTAPPFRPLTALEREQAITSIKQARADIVWVGLGMPKQEKLMNSIRDELPGTALIGIGAVFDFLAGTQPHAPLWLQSRGLEWAFRLATNPRRMWRRYAWNNPSFLALWLRDMVVHRLMSELCKRPGAERRQARMPHRQDGAKATRPA